MVAAAVASAWLLTLGYSLIAHRGFGIRNQRSVLAHIILHFVPVSYVVLQFFFGATLLLNTLYLLPFVLFFYTGRRTWDELFRLFGRKMYRVFYFGNTALMRVSPVLLAFGFLVDEALGAEGFRRVMLVYSGIHFLMAGWTMICIKEDILSRRANV